MKKIFCGLRGLGYVCMLQPPLSTETFFENPDFEENNFQERKRYTHPVQHTIFYSAKIF